MKELNKLFDDIEFQLNDESMKYRRLKYVNIHLKYLRYAFYHYL